MVPYARTIQQTLDSDADNTIELPAPPRGKLTRLVIVDNDGNQDGFEFAVYDRKDALPGETTSAETPDEGGTPVTHADAVHRLWGPETVAASNDEYAAMEIVVPYVNRDDRTTNKRPTDRIYLWIKPVAGVNATKVFDVGYSILGAGIT